MTEIYLHLKRMLYKMDEVTRQNLISRSNNGMNDDQSNWESQFVNVINQENDSKEHLNLSMQSTLAPDVLVEASSSIVTTIVVITIIVILIVAALFAMAIFIDYRQQAIAERQQQCIVKKRKSLRQALKLPKCGRVREPSGIIEDAEEPGQSRPPLETISEVV